MSKENLTFEQSLSELQEISDRLEKEDLSLEQAIELFESGIKLSKDCHNKLANAKQKIEKLTDTENCTND